MTKIVQAESKNKRSLIFAEAPPIQALAQSSASREQKQTEFDFCRGAACLNRSAASVKCKAGAMPKLFEHFAETKYLRRKPKYKKGEK